MENHSNQIRSIVVSAINFHEGGGVSVLNDVLKYLSYNLSDKYNIIALVHNKNLVKVKDINVLEFPISRRAWLFRLFYEYIYFSYLSRKINPILWLSLHDLSPNVKADVKAVYWQNTAPLHKSNFKEMLWDPKFAFFNLIYKYLYKINCKKNDYVIVQQQWLRNKFRDMFMLDNIIVANPAIEEEVKISKEVEDKRQKKYMFFYPTLPRIYKNVETICEAVDHLEKTTNYKFEVNITFDRDDNRYSKYICNKYSRLNKILFVGKLSRNQVFDCYNIADCLIFPSRLETWGLPISEFKKYNKPMIVSDLEYAHETVGDYKYAVFFDPKNAIQLADYMLKLMQGEMQFKEHKAPEIEPPFAKNWKELFEILLPNSY